MLLSLYSRALIVTSPRRRRAAWRRTFARVSRVTLVGIMTANDVDDDMLRGIGRAVMRWLDRVERTGLEDMAAGRYLVSASPLAPF